MGDRAITAARQALCSDVVMISHMGLKEYLSIPNLSINVLF